MTLSSKGQLTSPRALRETFGLGPGSRLQASIDPQGRLVLLPAQHAPEELFLHRPSVKRVLGLDDRERGIRHGGEA